METDDGLVGWGEAIGGAPGDVSWRSRSSCERRLAPIVVGRDPRDVAGAWTGDARGHVLGRQRWHRHVRHQRRWTWRSGTSPARPPARRCTRCWAAGAASVSPHAQPPSSRPDDLDRIGREFGASWSRAIGTSRAAGAMTCRSRSGATGARPRRRADRARRDRSRDGDDRRRGRPRRLGQQPRGQDGTPAGRGEPPVLAGGSAGWSTTSTGIGGCTPPWTRASAPARRAGTPPTSGRSSNQVRST